MMKKRNQQPTPEFTTGADGQQLVHVALANTDLYATLYVKDYQRLTDAGFSPFWALTNTGGHFRYVLVSARSPGNRRRSLTVARLIAGAGKGQQVSYADGDRLNLRAENLVLVEGPAKAAAAWLRPNDGTPPRKPKRRLPSDAHVTPVHPPVAPAAPATPTALTVTEQAPVAPRKPYAHHEVDMKALAQSVRERVATGVSYNGGTSR